MLLEQLVEEGRKPPPYDWDAYYRWFFGQLTGQEGGDFAFWSCSACFTINILFLPAPYGKCRRCDLIHLP